MLKTAQVRYDAAQNKYRGGDHFSKIGVLRMNN